MKNLILLGLIFLPFAMSSRVNAQTCYVESPYGCVVGEIPDVINLETGTQVDLNRAYWNANVDIANRRIQCDTFSFNDETAVYEKLSGSEYFHYPLYAGGGASLHDFEGDPMGYYGWRVSDGMYSGKAPLGSWDNPFIELITYNASNSGSQINAVRRWPSLPRWMEPNTRYDVCYDLDGAPLIPTGSKELGNTDLLPAQTFSIQLPPADTPVTERPEIVRLDTGQPVEFVRAEFDFVEDFVGSGGNCWGYEWREQAGAYVQAYKPEGASIVYRFSYAYTGGESVWGQAAPDDFRLETTTFSVNDFMAHTLNGASFIEIDGRGFNTWGSSPLSYYRCHFVSASFAPNRILLTPETSCDYTEANRYDGWGWNPATLQSCPPPEPVSTSNCDYTNASSSNGWGWNATAGESCPPLETVIISPETSNPITTNNCDYSAADQFDGWGWDAITQQSCAPLNAVIQGDDDCDYSNAENLGGWGWNPVLLQSCPPVGNNAMSPSTACIDTDGDGWGWNGTASCQVTIDSPIDITQPICVDAAPVGDGWGWNGIASCRI